MAASSNLIGNYHVFLSFRGTDVRNNFLGHLYTALEQKGIYTYVDSEELRKGEQITPALMKAIEDSHIAIIIFSENYASSSWCLEEVAKIMECKEQRDLVVFPVFYKVDPREVRTPRESYREAMFKHESKFGRDSEKVKRWKKALYDAGSLSGWDLNDIDEADLIKKIVEKISLQLGQKPLHIAKHPVGIYRQVVKLKSMLNLESRDVFMIGLWGQGGIGKTTLAKALYNDIFRGFEASCFLANVRETSNDSKDLVSLQKSLLSRILLGKKLRVSSVDEGINLIQDRLCHKKVLLVLDDVDDIKQLNALAGNCEWFGKGSRIIITTRDNHLLTVQEIGKDHIYEVKTLEYKEAVELFNKHAFLRNKKIVIRRDLVHSALHYANGLPLALEVLGSFLCGRREREWKSALNKLAKSPDKTINNVLKLSYDGLEDYAKEIFLDIACFFKQRSLEYIMKVLNSCYSSTTIGVQILVEKSLISKERETIQMHDLIQLMGVDIVKQECHNDPTRRSRLWHCEDIRDVLSREMGTDAVKAIVLVLPKTKAIYIGPSAFTNMRRLRLLIMINVHNSFQGPIYLPNELRWFEWPKCPSQVLKFPSGKKKLVGLDLHKSNIQIVMDQFKDFKYMTYLNFSECPLVGCMPDLNLTPNLKELDLHGCKNLECAHESIAYHAKLRLLNLKGCSNLHQLPNMLQSKNLQLLNLTGCSKLRRFPYIPNKIKGLKELYLKGTSIEELSPSIENLVSLENLSLINCKKLANLPPSIYKLPNLESLMLNGCSKLIKFPKEGDLSDLHSKTGFPKLLMLGLNRCNLQEVEFLENNSCFPYLRWLDLSQNNFAKLPTCRRLHNLRTLCVSECQQLQEIGKMPGQLQELWASDCESLSKIPSDIWAVNHIDLSCHDQPLFSRLFCQTLLPGKEMPRWLIPNKDGYISFTASKGLYKKFLALAICIVFRLKEGKQKGILTFCPYINGKSRFTIGGISCPSHLDHVCISYLDVETLWRVDTFGPNDSSSFQFGIRALGGAMVKKCGFRLICKPLEDDLEALYPDDQLLDPGLLYEFWHEDKKMTTEEENSAHLSLQRWQYHEDSTEDHTNEREDYDFPVELSHNDIVADFSVEKYRYSGLSTSYRKILPGGDIPEEFVLVEGNTISFMVSQDFYDKFLEIALCVVFSVEDGEKEIFFDMVPHVNGQRRNALSGSLGSFDSDHTWIRYLKPNVLWGVLEGAVDFLEFDEDYLQFSLTLRILGGTMEKLGYVLRCEQLDDDLKIVLEDNQLVDPASICETKLEAFSCSDPSEASDETSDAASYRKILPGGDIPEEFVLVEGNTISFMVSQDFYDKFLELALCVVFSVEDGEKEIFFDIVPHVNGQRRNALSGSLGSFDSDHTWIQYLKPNVLWGVLEGGVDFLEFDEDYLQFSLTLRILGGTMEKLGYVLRCEQLDDDLKIVLEDNQLVDPASIYETKLEAFSCSDPSEASDETSDAASYRKILPGGDIPEEFVLVEGNTISFMVSQDFYDKFLELALCVVFSVEDGEKEIIFDIVPHVNGQRRNALSGSLGSFDSDHTWIQYLKPNVLWGVLEGGVDFLEFDEDYLQFSLTLRILGGTMEKLGYVLRCEQLDDDLKIVLEDNQLVDPASIYEIKLQAFSRSDPSEASDEASDASEASDSEAD